MRILCGDCGRTTGHSRDAPASPAACPRIAPRNPARLLSPLTAARAGIRPHD